MYTAKSNSESYVNQQLFTSQAEVDTTDVVVASGQNLVAGQVVALLNNKVVAHNPGAANTSKTAVYIMAYDVDAQAGDTAAQAYNKGGFNSDALTWHTDVDTYEERVAAFAGTPISVNKARQV